MSTRTLEDGILFPLPSVKADTGLAKDPQTDIVGLPEMLQRQFKFTEGDPAVGPVPGTRLKVIFPALTLRAM